MKALRSTISLAILLLALTGTLFPTLSWAQTLNDAQALLLAGRYRDARELAARNLQNDLPPDRALPWRWIIAESYHREGDYEQAVAAYKALSVASRERLASEASLGLARCHLKMWDAKGAFEVLQTLRSRDLEDLNSERDELEAIATFAAGRSKEALKLFERLPKKTAAGWHYLGLITFNSGNYKKALQYFDQAISGAPGDYYDLVYRASCLLELGRLKEARSALDGILKIADTPEIRQLLGRLELRTERFPQAEASYRKALEMSPGYPEAQFGLMTALRRQGKKEKAQKAAKKFQELHVAQQEAMTTSYRLSQEQAANPEDPKPAETLALHYLSINDPAAAERMAWCALRADSRRIQARLCLARSLAMVARYREAAVQYRRILLRSPGHRDAENELRQLLRQHARRVNEPKRAR